MAKPPRDRRPALSRTYFITAKSWQGRTLFQSERLAQLFLETLFHYRSEAKFQLHEFVLMPNHVHLLLTPAVDVSLERAVQFIKGGFSHRVGKDRPALEVWQRGYVDRCIGSAADYAQHRDYIRLNPVRAHLAESPEEYRFSSAYPGFELDPPPITFKG